MDMEISPPQLRNIKENAPSIPEEIIEEILSRLPVKSLLKFRCVSKSWRFLIGSKRFIKTHLQNSTKNTTFAHHKIILNCTPPYHGLKQCSLGLLLNEPFTDSFTFDDSLKIKIGSDESICLVGCSNGLVCILVERKYFVLWNPSTRMSKKLPDIDDKIKHGRVTKYGFGYDESNGDYRVFAIVSVFWVIGRYQAMCKVYSLKTNSWKVVKQRDSSPFSGTGKFACGKLHWANICLDSRWDIVSFDLNSQAYGMVEQPCYSEVGFRLSLGVLGGCLCVLCDYQKTHFDIWVMKHYGVRESWDKVVSVSYLHCPRRGQSLTPFYVGSNGEIILRCGSTFIIYNPKDNVLRYLQISNFASFHEVDIYIESLVSLAPGAEQEMQSPKIIA